MNSIKTLVMLTAVLSMGGFFANQQAMAQQEVITAQANIAAQCQLVVGALNFGAVDPILHFAGSPEKTVNLNNANSNRQSSVTVLGADWIKVGGTSPADDPMSVGNTQFDDDNTASAGPYTALTTVAHVLATVPINNNLDTFWTLLVVLDKVPSFSGNAEQTLTFDFACVP